MILREFIIADIIYVTQTINHWWQVPNENWMVVDKSKKKRLTINFKKTMLSGEQKGQHWRCQN